MLLGDGSLIITVSDWRGDHVDIVIGNFHAVGLIVDWSCLRLILGVK
jgi:hypothetical protein